jgi:outer membrane protein OmpA-like peptidoglycan-associated protein
MTEAHLRDDNWAGISRLHKFIALILALILALTWWLGRGASSTFGCLPGAGSAGAAAGAIATATPAVISAPAAVTSASTGAAVPAAAATASAPAAATASSAAPAPEAAAATAAPAAPAAPTPAPAPAPAVESKPTPAPTQATATQSTPAPSVAAPSVAAQAAVAGKGLPVAKVHFALDKTKLWSGADNELSKVLAYLKANPGSKAVLSGFHDPSGNRDHNLELAKNRSHAVRDRLVQQGISLSRIIEEKPSETTGDGPPAEARRVEVSIRP